MLRNSRKMIAVRSMDAAKVYVPSVLVWFSVRPQLDGWAGTLFTTLFCMYTYSRLHSVFFDWWSTLYEITDEGIRLTTGLFFKKQTSVRWTDMASLQVSRTAVQRSLRCASVHIGIGSQSKPRLVLDAVSEAVAEEARARFLREGGAREVARSGDEPMTTGSPAEAASPVHGRTGSPTNGSLYTMGKLDYLLVSVTYGQFALIVPFCFGAYLQVSEWVNLPSPSIPEVLQGAGASWAAYLGLLTVVAIAVAYGLGIAWVRYRGFDVHVCDGTLNVAGGLVSHENRRVLGSQVVGLKLEQNPLMRVMGYGKLSFVSRESGSKVGANVIFPVVALQRLAEGVAEHFPAYDGIATARRISSVRPGLVLLAGNVVVLWVAWVVVRAWHPQMAFYGLGSLALAQICLANRLWTSVDNDPENTMIYFRRGFLWVTQYAVPVSSIHVARESRGPIARFLRTSVLSFWVYDARTVRLRLFRAPKTVVTSVCTAMSVELADASATREEC